MEKKYSGAPGMVSPAYTSYGSSCGGYSGYGASPTMGYPTNVAPAMSYPTTSMSYPTTGGYGYPSTGYGYPSTGATYSSPGYVAPTQVAPANVSPTKNIVQQNVMKTIVPHVHPTHKTTINQHVYQHQHYFPCTQSVMNTCCNQQMICCGPVPQPTTFCPPNPCC